MAQYQACRLDDAGKIFHRSDFDAADDNEALEIVRVLPEELGFEIWCGPRLVGHIGREDKITPDAPIFSPKRAAA